MAFFFAHLLKPVVRSCVFSRGGGGGPEVVSAFVVTRLASELKLYQKEHGGFTRSATPSRESVFVWFCCCLHSVSDETSVSLNVSQREESFVC